MYSKILLWKVIIWYMIFIEVLFVMYLKLLKGIYFICFYVNMFLLFFLIVLKYLIFVWYLDLIVTDLLDIYFIFDLIFLFRFMC